MRKVAEVANLTILACCYEDVARTKSAPTWGRVDFFGTAPFGYYYCRYNAATKLWNPWQEIDVEIPHYTTELGYIGNCPVSIAWNNGIMLFLPQMSKKIGSVPNADASFSDTGKKILKELNPIGYWEIKMGWTECKERQLEPSPV